MRLNIYQQDSNLVQKMKKYLLMIALLATSVVTVSCREDIYATQVCTPCGDTCCSLYETCIDKVCTSSTNNSCQNDAECKDGYVCLENICTKVECDAQMACFIDAQCQDGYACKEHCCTEIPRQTCTTDNDCPNNQVCRDNFCMTAVCTKQAECPIDYVCYDYICEKQPEAQACKLNCAWDHDCLPAETCNEDHECIPKTKAVCMAFDDSAHYQCRQEYVYDYTEDSDGDGILNAVECHARYEQTGPQSPHSDPCLPDSDGDTLIDSIEDLNQNGIYEPENGETNPIAADSDQFTKPEIAARKAAISAKHNLLASSCGSANVSYFEDSSDKDVTLESVYIDIDNDPQNGFYDEASFLDMPHKNVYAAYGSDCKNEDRWFCFNRFENFEHIQNPDFIFADVNGKTIVKSHGKITTETFHIPNEKWNNGIFEKDTLMSIPAQTVTAYTFDAELHEGMTLEMYRGHYMRRLLSDTIPYQFFTDSMYYYYPSPGTASHCIDNKISVLAVHTQVEMETTFWPKRGTFHEYTIAVTCKEDMKSKTSPAYIAMENIKLSTDIIPFKEETQHVASPQTSSQKVILQSALVKDCKSDGGCKIALRGLPIASSLHVSLSGCSYNGELQRNAETNGWRYNVEDNTVQLLGISPDDDDGIAITYSVWSQFTY